MTKVKFALFAFEKEVSNTGGSPNGGNSPEDPRPRSQGRWRDVVLILMLCAAIVTATVQIIGVSSKTDTGQDQREEVEYSPPDSLARSSIPE